MLADPSDLTTDPAPTTPQGVKFVETDDGAVPQLPETLNDTGIDPQILADLLLKLAYTVATFTTEAATQHVCLPAHMVAELLEQLKTDRLVEILGTSGPFTYRYAITERGRERAARLMEISGYVGPAPIPLQAYGSALAWQCDRFPKVSPERLSTALAEMVLPETVVQIAGLAVASGRSLFIHGPPGNGKTTLGHLVHGALEGALWIPYCVGVESNVIRVFDPRFHERRTLDLSREIHPAIDRRWVCIRRPFLVAAGEITIDALELTYSHARGYYEAPLHVKANGGIFLLDDFGRQRVEPRLLLNRWTFPLEHGLDYLTLQTGQKLAMPFRQMLVVCTNLDPETVMDPAFLRRIGYRLLLDDPSPESYARIFERYAARSGLTVPHGLIEALIQRYRLGQRRLRSCEPRDLIERVCDICRYRGQPLHLNQEVLDLAWRGYFGDTKP